MSAHSRKLRQARRADARYLRLLDESIPRDGPARLALLAEIQALPFEQKRGRMAKIADRCECCRAEFVARLPDDSLDDWLVAHLLEPKDWPEYQTDGAS